MSSEHRILCEADASCLKRRGHYGPSPRNPTFDLIHKRALSDSDSPEYSEVAMDDCLPDEFVEPKKYAIEDADPSDPYVAFREIPRYAISEACLQYLGFTDVKAADKWQEWENWSDEYVCRETDKCSWKIDISFIDFACNGFARSAPDEYSENDNAWRICMNGFGINTKTQADIMTAVFREERLSKSCKFWVNDTVRMRYNTLIDIHEASERRAARKVSDLGLAALTLKTASSSSSGGAGHAVDTVARAAGSSSVTGRSPSRSKTTTQARIASGVSTKVWGDAESIAMRNAPGELWLYKGMHKSKTVGLFNRQGNVDEITRLLSPPPTDHSPFKLRFYFTPDYQLAQRNASYAKKRDRSATIYVLAFKIADNAVERLAMLDAGSFSPVQYFHFPTDAWKEFLWLCRKSVCRRT